MLSRKLESNKTNFVLLIVYSKSEKYLTLFLNTAYLSLKGEQHKKMKIS